MKSCQQTAFWNCEIPRLVVCDVFTNFKDTFRYFVDDVSHISELDLISLQISRSNPTAFSFHVSEHPAMGCRSATFLSWSLFRLVTLDAFKLLDVGAPRTGTQSFYDAMKILNLNPVHSGYQSEVRPALCEYLFRNGSLDDALGVLDGFDAAMDEPFMLMYEEIMAAFPEAKFVLTISDAESWFDNYVEMERFLATYHSQALHEKYGALPPECKALTFWGCWFLNSTQEDKDLDC